MNSEDIKMCNCANCSKELLGRSMLSWYNELTLSKQQQLPPMCHGYLDSRPYCSFCFRIRQRWLPLPISNDDQHPFQRFSIG